MHDFGIFIWVTLTLAMMPSLTHAACPIDSGTVPVLQFDPLDTIFLPAGPSYTYHMYADTHNITWTDSIVTSSLDPASNPDCGGFTYNMREFSTGLPLSPAAFSEDYSEPTKVLSIKSTDLGWWASNWFDPYQNNPG